MTVAYRQSPGELPQRADYRMSLAIPDGNGDSESESDLLNSWQCTVSPPMWLCWRNRPDPRDRGSATICLCFVLRNPILLRLALAGTGSALEFLPREDPEIDMRVTCVSDIETKRRNGNAKCKTEIVHVE